MDRREFLEGATAIPLVTGGTGALRSPVRDTALTQTPGRVHAWTSTPSAYAVAAAQTADGFARVARAAGS